MVFDPLAFEDIGRFKNTQSVEKVERARSRQISFTQRISKAG